MSDKNAQHLVTLLVGSMELAELAVIQVVLGPQERARQVCPVIILPFTNVFRWFFARWIRELHRKVVCFVFF